jgi:hypothetical protein
LCGAWLKGTPTGSPHNTKVSLIASIKEVFSKFPREDLKLACSQFRSRLEKVVTAEGDFIL